MRQFRYLLFLGVMIAAMHCRDTIFVGDEYLGNSSPDTDRGQETSVDTNTDVNEDSETETGSDLETVPIEDTDTALGCGVPAEFSWTSSEPLILPPAGSSIKVPTVVRYEDEWLVYATTLSDPLNMNFLSFTDWDQAGAALQTPVSENENLANYKAAPQLFYFAPQDLWYLVYQEQEPAYSTTHDPSDVLSWSSPCLQLSRTAAIPASTTG